MAGEGKEMGMRARDLDAALDRALAAAMRGVVADVAGQDPAALRRHRLPVLSHPAGALLQVEGAAKPLRLP
jgi:hypothetical protein